MALDAPGRQLSQVEFIALMAMNFAMVAFSIDAMLPALPEIGAALVPDNLNRAQLVLTSFVFGMGIGTLFAGPLSDSYGRKPVIAASALLFLIGAAWAAAAPSIEQLVAARIVQGLGVSGPRIVGLAIVRDLYQGRGMARIMSFVMMIFTLVPAIAPLAGALIIAQSGWRMIFIAGIGFCAVSTGWLMIRQPETLPAAERRAFHIAGLRAAARECLGHRVFVISILAQSLALGMLFACLSSTQPIFEITWGRAENFPLWFAMIALVAGVASILNARLVIRLGMRRMIWAGFLLQMIASGSVVALLMAGALSFAVYVIWTVSVFFMVGLVLGNLNALAMEPVGHLAGLAASVLGSVATVLSVFIAIPVGLAFDGTPMPLAAAFFVLSLLGLLVIRAAPQ